MNDAGLRFRPIASEDDADALQAVHAGRMGRDRVDSRSTAEDYPSVEDLRAALAEIIAEGQQDRWLVAEIKGRVVGYSRLGFWHEDDGRWVYLIRGWTLPEWRGQGIGTSMLHWGEAHARHLAATQHPGEKFEFAANASRAELDTAALLLHEGYTPRYTVLEMGLESGEAVQEHSLPPGIQVRPVLAEHYSQIAASVEAAYRDEYDDNRFKQTFDPVEYTAILRASKYDPSLWQVAWDGERVAGQVLSVVENGRGEVLEVSVQPDWRRRGLARALLSGAIQALRQRGVEEIRLKTVAEFRTRASDLYRSVGFRVLKEFLRYRKPAD